MEIHPAVIGLLSFLVFAILFGGSALIFKRLLRKKYETLASKSPLVSDQTNLSQDAPKPPIQFEDITNTWETSFFQAYWGSCVTIVTLGLGFPLVLLEYKRWTAFHSIYKGKRLRFTATLKEMYIQVLKEAFLTTITFGVYWLLRSPETWF